MPTNLSTYLATGACYQTSAIANSAAFPGAACCPPPPQPPAALSATRCVFVPCCPIPRHAAIYCGPRPLRSPTQRGALHAGPTAMRGRRGRQARLAPLAPRRLAATATPGREGSGPLSPNPRFARSDPPPLPSCRCATRVRQARSGGAGPYRAMHRMQQIPTEFWIGVGPGVPGGA